MTDQNRLDSSTDNAILIRRVSPAGYNLPSEYTKLAEECSRYEKDDKVWICKPVGQSQGRGIFLFRVSIFSRNTQCRNPQTLSLTCLSLLYHGNKII